MLACVSRVCRMHKSQQAAPDQFFRTIAEAHKKGCVGKVDGPVLRKDGDDFSRRVQQRRELCGPKGQTGIRNDSLCHVGGASTAGEDTGPPDGLSEASKGRATL